MRARWKAGCSHAALAHVQRLFAGEQSVAEDEAGALHDDAAVVFARFVLDEQLLDQLGMVELVDVAVEAADSGRGRRSRGHCW